MTILAILFLFFFAVPGQSWEIVNDWNGVIFARWSYGGNAVWSDKDRDEIIANASTSSKTVTAADFTRIFPSADEIALTTTTFDLTMVGDTFVGNVRSEDVVRLLRDKAYLRDLYAQKLKERRELLFEQAESSGAIDNAAAIRRLTSHIELIRRKYANFEERRNQ